MKPCLSRLTLLSAALCLGAGLGIRLARAEGSAWDTARPPGLQTTEAVLRALGLADAARPTSMPAAPAPIASGQPTPAKPAADVAYTPRAPMSAQLEWVLTALGLMPAVETTVAVRADPPPGTQARSTASDPEPPAPAATPSTAAQRDAPGAAPEPATASAPATTPLPAPPQLQLADRTLVALDEAALDTLRGGFIGDSGLKISFGIERAVYINGDLVTTTSLNLSELGSLSAGKGLSLSLPAVGTSVALLQSGAGNTMLSNLGPAAIGTAIQNTLDGQNIQTRTIINATVNSLSVLKSLELQRNLRSATMDALRR
jgi:hypothetical protein